MTFDPGSRLLARAGTRRRRTLAAAANTTLTSLVAVLSMVGSLWTEPVLALRCFSCADCSVGVALSASKQQCPPEETFCAAVSRPQVDGWGYPSSSIHRGCASSLNVACEQPDTMGKTTTSMTTTTMTTTKQTATNDHHRENHTRALQSDAGGKRGLNTIDDGRGDGTSQSTSCCSTDLCNGFEDARADGQRRSEERLRTLMEGNPRKRREGFFSWGVSSGVSGEGPMGGSGDISRPERAAAAAHNKMEGGDGNSAQSARAGGVGGSRFATVLVIVGTFSQVFWLVSRLMEE